MLIFRFCRRRFSVGRTAGVAGGLAGRPVRVQGGAGLPVQPVAEQGAARAVQGVQQHSGSGARRPALFPGAVQLYADHAGRHGSPVAQDRAERRVPATVSAVAKPSRTGETYLPTLRSYC